MVKNLPAVQERRVQSLGEEDQLEKGMATHSSILAWRIPWTEEPGGLQSMGSCRIRHDWMTNTFTLTFLEQRENFLCVIPTFMLFLEQEEGLLWMHSAPTEHLGKLPLSLVSDHWVRSEFSSQRKQGSFGYSADLLIIRLFVAENPCHPLDSQDDSYAYPISVTSLISVEIYI